MRYDDVIITCLCETATQLLFEVIMMMCFVVIESSVVDRVGLIKCIVKWCCNQSCPGAEASPSS